VTTPLKTRLVIADDHAIVRRGLQSLFDPQPDFEVVAQAEDGADAVRQVLETDADLAVLDISMPRKTGLAAAREILQHRPETRILMLSMHDNEQYFFEALKAGAAGYVLKSAADRELVEACRSAMRGESVIYGGAVTALIRDYLDRSRRGETRARTRSPRASSRSSSSSPRPTPTSRSPRSSSSAARRSSDTGPTSWTSSACATGSS
jgi:DNA-binding NarL/FixJ family response regulator